MQLLLLAVVEVLVGVDVALPQHRQTKAVVTDPLLLTKGKNRGNITLFQHVKELSDGFVFFYSPILT
ncbi:hypothetical protein [Larkinella sp.]|uniref:hypothetical protein n=1 Tax=Larkinella sp. TaxID=2034517 RepID=UPI003BA8C5A8